MKKTTILYSRVSTEEQGKNGYSLDFQKYQLLKYAEDNKIEDYVHFEEFGESATSMKRPKMKLMLDMIKDGEVEEIIFYKIDRISRNIIDFAELNKLCELANVKLTSMTEPIEQSAMGEFNQNIMIAIAELESKRISERSKSGYVGMLERGIYPFGGRMPLGISKTKDKLLYHNDDIKIVKEMFEMNYRGESHQEIRRVINKKYNLNLAKNTVTKQFENTLYKGYLDYQGKRYEFLEPITVGDGVVPDFSSHKRNIETYTYKLKAFLPEYYVETKSKYSVALGEMKHYTYYRKPNTKMIIEENKFFRYLAKQIKLTNEESQSILKKKIKKLDEIYVLSDMDMYDYKQLKKEIYEKVEEIWAVKNVQEITISDSYDVEVKYKKTNSNSQK